MQFVSSHCFSADDQTLLQMMGECSRERDLRRNFLHKFPEFLKHSWKSAEISATVIAPYDIAEEDIQRIAG